MSERFDPNQSSTGSANGHLDDEVLSEYVDDRLARALQAAVRGHLDSCAECRRRVAETRALTTMLQALPAPALRRSFQLRLELIAAERSIWDRLASWLLPALPALRAATVALALLFAAVTLRELTVENDGPVSDLVAPKQSAVATLAPTDAAGRNTAAIQNNQTQQTQPAAAFVQPTATSMPFVAPEQGGAEEDAAPAADTDLEAAAEMTTGDAAGDQALAQTEGEPPASDGEAGSTAGRGTAGADEAAEESLDLPGDAAETENIAPQATAGPDDMAFAAMAAASPAATPTSTASPTASPTSTATTLPSPTATPLPSEPVASATPADDDDGPGAWSMVQIGLAILLVASATTWFFVSRRGHRSHAVGPSGN